MIARAPTLMIHQNPICPLENTFAEWPLSLSIMGRTNDAVFPDPVRAMPTTSRPSMIGGIVFR